MQAPKEPKMAEDPKVLSNYERSIEAGETIAKMMERQPEVFEALYGPQYRLLLAHIEDKKKELDKTKKK
jgi:type II secretory pathway component PulF